MSYLQVKNVVKSFGNNKVLENISIDFEKGEIHSIIGENGAGKSTFIKRFMDVLVLPNMEDRNERERATDELPQSAAGKTIMTTEPKFVPKDAAVIHLNRDVEVKVRLIDCVGYLVKGASGYEEAGHERMVKPRGTRKKYHLPKRQ